MSHFYGTLNGNRGEASRCGTKGSGMITYAAGWEGAIRVMVRYDEANDIDRYSVALTPWHGSGGETQVLVEGVLSTHQIDPNKQLSYLIKPLEEFHARMVVARRTNLI